jgi:hypothetical protein
LQKLKGIIVNGLEHTAELWPSVKEGFAVVHQAAEILKNQAGQDGKNVRDAYEKNLQAVSVQAKKAGEMRPVLEHFLKVSDSYLPGLFHCCDVADLPRTNNALEQLFGSTRHHERRCTGRKVASPGLVLRGSVRVVAGLGARQRNYHGEELAPAEISGWNKLRTGLERRRQSRALRHRFRRNPAAYLGRLEDILLQSVLPA